MIPAFDMNLIKRKYALRDKIARRRTRALLETLEGRGIINEPQLKEYIFWYGWRDHPLVNAVYGSYYDSLFAGGLSNFEDRWDDVTVYARFQLELRKRPGGPAFLQNITQKLNRLDKGSIVSVGFSSKERKQKALTRLFKKTLKKHPEINRVYQDSVKQILKKHPNIDRIHV